MTSPAWEKMLAARGKKQRRAPFKAGPEHAKAGDWYASDCGCTGKYRLGERGRLVWRPDKPCAAHTPPYDPAAVPTCEPAHRIKAAKPPPQFSAINTTWEG